MIPLPASFLDRPIAHRALHDRAQGRAEVRVAGPALDAQGPRRHARPQRVHIVGPPARRVGRDLARLAEGEGVLVGNCIRL